jgi:UDP-glucose 4-epimerase
VADKTVLVTGATGALGPALVNRLLAAGYSVRSYGLDTPAPGLYASPIEHITGNITDPIRLAASLPEVNVVFHLAALLHIENPDPGLAPHYQRINVEGSRIVAEQAARAGVQRIVYFSTVKIYGIRQRQPVTEDHPVCPETLYAQTKLAGEDAIRSVPGIENCVLRLSPVFGPRLKGSWSRLVSAIRRGMFLPIGTLRNAHSLVCVDDVAQAAFLVGQHTGVHNQIYNVVGFEDPTLSDILSSIYTALGKQLPRIAIPGWAALAGAHVLDAGLKLMHRRSPLTPERVRHFIDDEVYSGTKLRHLGFAPALTLEQSWKETIIQMHELSSIQFVKPNV